MLQPEVMPCEEIQAEHQEAQAKQKEHDDKTATSLELLTMNSEVWANPTLPQQIKQKATVVKVRDEPRSDDVRLESGTVLRRNRKELYRSAQPTELPTVGGEEEVQNEERLQNTATGDDPEPEEGAPTNTLNRSPGRDRSQRSRSGRIIRRPQHLQDYDCS